jgi:hypothetical protein
MGQGGFGTIDATSAAGALWGFGSPGSGQEQHSWGGAAVGQQMAALQGSPDMLQSRQDVSPHRSAVGADYGLGDGAAIQRGGYTGNGAGNGLRYLGRQPSAPAVTPSRQQPFHAATVQYPQQQQRYLGEYPPNGGITGTASDPDVISRQLASLGLMSSDALLPAIGFEEQQRQQHLIQLQLLAKQPLGMDAQHQLQQQRQQAALGSGLYGGNGALSSNGTVGGGYAHLLGNGAALDASTLRREGSAPVLPIRTLSDPSRLGPPHQPMQVLCAALLPGACHLDPSCLAGLLFGITRGTAYDHCYSIALN